MTLLVACRSGERPATVVPLPPHPAVAAPVTTAEVVRALDLQRFPRIVELTTGLQRAIAGSLRAEVTEAAVTLAADRPASRFVGSARLPSGWS